MLARGKRLLRAVVGATLIAAVIGSPSVTAVAPSPATAQVTIRVTGAGYTMVINTAGFRYGFVDGGGRIVAPAHAVSGLRVQRPGEAEPADAVSTRLVSAPNAATTVFALGRSDATTATVHVRLSGAAVRMDVDPRGASSAKSGVASTGDYGYATLFDVAGRYMLVTGSDIDGRYGGTRLRSDGASQLQATLPDSSETAPGPLTALWRALIVGDLATVVRSDLVEDLAPPWRITESPAARYYATDGGTTWTDVPDRVYPNKWTVPVPDLRVDSATGSRPMALSRLDHALAEITDDYDEEPPWKN